MKITIDTDEKILICTSDTDEKSIELYSDEAFEILSAQWLKVGWNQKYGYTFSWMGRPIIQLPEDMIRTQEVIYKLQPDIIIETGVAHGGSLIYYSSLCKILNKGRVIGVDIEIRSHNRHAIETHPLNSFITLIEGSSTSQPVIEQVKNLIKPHEVALVILDSNHTYKHVLEELELYSQLVSLGSYIVATDGLMKDLHDVPRGKREWGQDNPINAVSEFLQSHKEFVLEQPPWVFNESSLNKNITHWPMAWLKRIC